MTEEEKMALAASDKAKKDGEGSLPGDTVKEEIKKDAESATGNIDSLLAKLDAACKRMDAMEEAAMDKSKKDGDEEEKDKKEEDKKDADEGDMPGDPKEVVADKKRKDADEGEKEELKKVADKARKDAAAAEANSAAVMKRMAALEALMKPRSDEDQAALASAQSRADSVFSALGSRAKPSPPCHRAEGPLYRLEGRGPLCPPGRSPLDRRDAGLCRRGDCRHAPDGDWRRITSRAGST
jgi:chromosome segregation ATPase